MNERQADPRADAATLLNEFNRHASGANITWQGTHTLSFCVDLHARGGPRIVQSLRRRGLPVPSQRTVERALRSGRRLDDFKPGQFKKKNLELVLEVWEMIKAKLIKDGKLASGQRLSVQSGVDESAMLKAIEYFEPAGYLVGTAGPRTSEADGYPGPITERGIERIKRVFQSGPGKNASAIVLQVLGFAQFPPMIIHLDSWGGNITKEQALGMYDTFIPMVIEVFGPKGFDLIAASSDGDGSRMSTAIQLGLNDNKMVPTKRWREHEDTEIIMMTDPMHVANRLVNNGLYGGNGVCVFGPWMLRHTHFLKAVNAPIATSSLSGVKEPAAPTPVPASSGEHAASATAIAISTTTSAVSGYDEVPDMNESVRLNSSSLLTPRDYIRERKMEKKRLLRFCHPKIHEFLRLTGDMNDLTLRYADIFGLFLRLFVSKEASARIRFFWIGRIQAFFRLWRTVHKKHKAYNDRMKSEGEPSKFGEPNCLPDETFRDVEIALDGALSLLKRLKKSFKETDWVVALRQFGSQCVEAMWAALGGWGGPLAVWTRDCTFKQLIYRRAFFYLTNCLRG